MNNSPDHPAIVRLRAELDAAWEGIRTLDALDAVRRERVVAELRAGLPDVASRAARAVGSEATIAEICRYAHVEVVSGGGSSRATIWDDLVRAAAVAANAAG